MTSPTLLEARAPTSRRKARVIALQVMYEIDGARHDWGRALENRLKEEHIAPPVEAFARKLITGILEHREEIDTTISTYAPTWPIEQMAVVDRNVLRVAIYEIMMGGETPPKVAINEAVELGKVFGSDNSPKFVNGVLGSVMQSAELEEKLR